MLQAYDEGNMRRHTFAAVPRAIAGQSEARAAVPVQQNAQRC